MTTTPIPTTHPGFRAWLIWMVALVAYMIAVINRTSLSAVGLDAAQRFHADASTLSLFAVVQLAVYGLMQLPVGLLLDRWGARPIIVIGMILMGLGQLIIAISPSVGVAILARMILGAGDAAVFPSVLRVIDTWFPRQRAPIMVQTTGVVGQAGQVLSILPLAALVHGTSWTIAFGGIAGLCGMFTVLLFLIVRNHPPQRSADVSVDTNTGSVRVITSAIDTRMHISEAWKHPGTRLGFWSHFTTPFSSVAFTMLWGIPFLIAGEGRTATEAELLTTLCVVVGIVIGPIMGAFSSRNPHLRSSALVLPTIGIHALTWLVVLSWPGPAPVWLLVILMIVLGTGGPASLVGIDHARAHNPSHRLSTATGITNGAGFIASLIAVFLIGETLNILGGTVNPAQLPLGDFRLAFLTQFPLWALGVYFILREGRKTRNLLRSS